LDRKQRRQEQKAAERRERLRQKKHQQQLAAAKARQDATAPSAPSPPPNFIDLAYGSVDMLHLTGPLVPAAWTIPETLEELYRKHGVPVPPPVQGFLLVDTGATSTCITMEAAAELQLMPRRISRSYGAGGLTENPMFWARLQIDIDNTQGAVTTAELDQEVAGIPGLEACYANLDVKFSRKLGNVPPTKVRLIGLLGREFLRHATLLYEGSKGHARLTLDMDSFQPRTVPGS
jgi:hypothetical protein